MPAPRSTFALVLAAALSSAACRGRTLHAELGAEIAYAAVIAESGGTLRFSTGLLRADGAERVEAPAGSVRVLGWTASQLAPLDLPSDQELGAEPLRLAGPCEEPLPQPAAALEGAEGELSPVAAASVGALTARWLVERCGGVPSGASFAEVGCFELGARSEIHADGCALSVEIDLPELAALMRGRVQRDRTVCLESAGGGPFASCSGSAETSSIALSCAQKEIGACPIDLFVAEAPAHGVRVRRVRVVDGEGPADVTRGEQFRVGSVADLLITGDRAIAVAAPADNVREIAVCAAPIPTALRFLDLERVEVVGSATAPDCLGSLLADPTSSRGFLGVYVRMAAERRSIVLGRFDERGREVLGTEVSNLPAPEGVRYSPVNLAAIAGPPARIGLWVRGSTPESVPERRRPEVLVTFDPITLEQRELSVSVDGAAGQHLAAVGPDRFALSSEENNCLILFTGAAERVRPAIECGSLTADLREVLHHPASGLLLATDQDASPGVWVLSSERLLRSAAVFQLLARPTSLAIWPGDPRTVAVTAYSAPVGGQPSSTVLLRFDPFERRFLVGAVPFADSPVTRLRVDARGRLWGTMAWHGEVVRIELF